MSFWDLLLVGWFLSGSLMFLLWTVYLVRDDPSIVDIGWAGSFTLVALRMHVADGEAPLRDHLMLALVLLWSLRLVWILVERAFRGQVDLRYQELDESWKTGLWWKYFFFFQAQALSVVVLMLPFAVVYSSSRPEFSFFDGLGLAICLIGITGEAWADASMRRFRAKPENKGEICREGLWYYSRHPNYFFEIVVWCGFAAFALHLPMGWVGIASPLLMLGSILKVTGVPATEAHLLVSKGDKYREYQRTTSMLIPWFPKTD